MNWMQWLTEQGYADAKAVEQLAPVFAKTACRYNVLSDDAKTLAYTLAQQIQSRITTQPLHFRDGNEESALKSVYELFGHAREQVEKVGVEGGVVADLAWEVLNQHVRPFTAQWHKRSVDGDLKASDDVRREFRGELIRLQTTLAQYALLLRFLVDPDTKNQEPLKGEDEDKKNWTSCDAITPSATYYSPLSRVIPNQLSENDQSHAMFEREMSYIKTRRTKAKLDNHTDNLVGVAFSGGGIRSFTVGLGVMQRLAKADLVRHIDIISSVSGGSYLATFLTSFWQSEQPQSTQSTQGVSAQDTGLECGQLPLGGTNNGDTPAVRHARNNSKSLLAGGLMGQLNVVALLFAGIVGNLIAVLPIILIVVVLLKLGSLITSSLLHIGDPITSAYDVAAVFRAAGIYAFQVLIVLGFVLLVLYRFAPRRLSALLSKMEQWVVRALFLVLLAMALSALIWCYNRLSFHLEPGRIFLVFLFMPIILMFLAWLLGPGNLIGRSVLAAVGFTGPILFLVSILVANDWLNNATYTPSLWFLWITISIGLFFVIDVNLLTPLRYYRDRLVHTYMIHKSHAADDDAQVTPANFLTLSRLRETPVGAPYPILNAAINVPTSKVNDLRGRNADFFVFTPHYIGSSVTGYCDTQSMEQPGFDPRLDLGTAMAISGAAASSHMGVQKQFAKYAFWLTFVNARLGYWLPNPNHINNNDINPRNTLQRLIYGRPGAFSLIREMLTYRMDEQQPFVNLSDGGHIENLGIYELLRRRCKFIIAVDAEADPSLQFGSLNQLIRYAKIDFGIDIEFPYINDLERNDQGTSAAHFTLGTVSYDENDIGLLLYIKSTLTGNERDYIKAYQEKHPTFPHQTTVDQFFDEDQFEAYRALGWHMAHDLFNSELMSNCNQDHEDKKDSPNELTAFFQRLEFHLLRQKHHTNVSSECQAKTSKTPKAQ